MEKLILAIDQGTTSSRAILFDKHGATRAVAHREFPQHYPQDGWVEHDPDDIWSSAVAVIAEVIAKAKTYPEAIAAIGIANQRETTLLWNRKTGRPIYPAIVWQDRRTASLCRQLINEGMEPVFRSKTGLVLDPYFSGTKLAWLLDNVDGARTQAANGELAFGTVDSWLIWNLTGGKLHATDTTNASRTLLYNIHSRSWDDDLLEILGIPFAVLPEVRECSALYAPADGRCALGGAPITGVAGDQHAALFGQACFDAGMAKNTYGTGCFLLMNTGGKAVPSHNNLLTTIAWTIGGKTEYALEGSVFMAGAIVQWLRDELGLIDSAEQCERIAAPDNGGVYLIPAFTGLGAPHWDPCARGAIFGLTRGATRAHLCRAALESIAFQSADLIGAMEADADTPLKELRVDGGVARSTALLQFQADLLGVRVVRPRAIETTALGAAYLAGLSVGYWDGTDAIAKNWEVDVIFEPRQTQEFIRPLRAKWERAVERSKAWVDAD